MKKVGKVEIPELVQPEILGFVDPETKGISLQSVKKKGRMVGFWTSGWKSCQVEEPFHDSNKLFVFLKGSAKYTFSKVDLEDAGVNDVFSSATVDGAVSGEGGIELKSHKLVGGIWLDEVVQEAKFDPASLESEVIGLAILPDIKESKKWVLTVKKVPDVFTIQMDSGEDAKTVALSLKKGFCENLEKELREVVTIAESGPAIVVPMLCPRKIMTPKGVYFHG